MKIIKVIFLSYLALIFSISASAQDLFFSQIQSAQTYLCPSFAGSTGNLRIAANHRNQWPGITTAFQTYSFSTDTYINKFRSGLGGILMYDKAGSADLNTFIVGLQYSYRVKLSKEWQLIQGIQTNVCQKSIDVSKLNFPDEVSAGLPSSAPIYVEDSEVKYFDFSTSTVLYSNQLWLGAVVDHLSEPNYSFMGSEATSPLKVTILGGRNIKRARSSSEPRIASLCFRYSQQRSFKQLDIGAYGYLDLFNFGVWYRGFPAFKNENTKNHFIDHDALVFLFGVTLGSLHLAYSYDFQISRLALNAAGAHEISIIFQRVNSRFECKNYSTIFHSFKFKKNREKKDKDYLEIF